MKLKPQNFWLEKTESSVAGETPNLTGELLGGAHKVLEHTQNHPPGNQHQKGPIRLWVAGEVTEGRWRTE